MSVKLNDDFDKDSENISVKGLSWELFDTDERLIKAISQQYEISEILSRLLNIRNIEVGNVDSFLNPTIKDSLSNPFLLKDMEKAANKIADIITENKKIVIYGDYDVDGATSSSFLKKYFKELGYHSEIYIPDRITEGYGPNANALTMLKNKGMDLCITVDCGTMSFEPLQKAKDVGLEVIIVDHHLSAETLPEAYAIVNPNRIDENSDQGHLAAVGVCFMIAVAVNKILSDRGWFKVNKKPNLLNLLDIVALGTVCDMVPLKGVNRAFVSQGLKVIKSRSNVGIAALADISNVNATPACYHLGFNMGPRINAGGRVGKSYLGAKLLSTDDAEKASEIAIQLDEYNAERRQIESLVLQEAIEQIEREKKYTNPVIFAVGENWHPGVVGIVASRVTERYDKPTAIITIDDASIGKASARSVKGIDFGSAIVAANQLDLVMAGGGHAMAAGFTIKEDKIEEMYDFLCKKFQSKSSDSKVKKRYFDSYLSLNALNVELCEQIEQVGPYGSANSEPKFIFKNVQIVKSDIVGVNHVRCILKTIAAGSSGRTIKAMAFRSAETSFGQVLLTSLYKNVSIVAKVKLNVWNGQQKVELLIEDLIHNEDS